METIKTILMLTAMYSFANIVMISVEYIGLIFKKPLDPENVRKKARSLTVSLLATVLLGAGVYVIPQSLHTLAVICQYAGCAVFAVSFVMQHFYVEI